MAAAVHPHIRGLIIWITIFQHGFYSFHPPTYVGLIVNALKARPDITVHPHIRGVNK